jgi:hypothetical protein
MSSFSSPEKHFINIKAARHLNVLLWTCVQPPSSVCSVDQRTSQVDIDHANGTEESSFHPQTFFLIIFIMATFTSSFNF